MTREQMIAWLTLEGHTIHRYGEHDYAPAGHCGLWEAKIGEGSTCRYVDEPGKRNDTWSWPLGHFDGGTEISWNDLTDDALRDLIELLEERYDPAE